MMQVTDKYGEVITVTDLDAAIRQAARFKNYRSGWADNQERKQYWTDLHGKLLRLRKTFNNNTNK